MIDDIPIAGSDIVSETSIHPLGLFAIIVLGLCVLFLPRRWSIVPFIVVACFIPTAQRIVVFGLDFPFLRIMVLFGFCRLILKKDFRHFTWIDLDTAMALWVVSAMAIYILREASSSAVINRLGFGFDAFGMYFLFRSLVQSWDDVSCIIWSCVVISIPLAALFLFEQQTSRNLFSIFGGVRPITIAREGRIRAQGAFPHSILAGCFWACLVPFFAALWWKSVKARRMAIIAILMSMIIVVACASSTPVMGVISAVVGGLFFYFRRHMSPVRWSVLMLLTGLHFIMDAPVWHLISRVSAVGGSTGYHRYRLIDRAIRHFSEWAILGTSSTAHWGWGLQDVTNQYVLEGVRGGFLTLCLFIATICIAFKDIGKLWRQNADNPYHLAISWALGVSLFVHCTNFIGVSYFGQIHLLWYLLLATIGSLTVFSNKLSALKTSIRSGK